MYISKQKIQFSLMNNTSKNHTISKIVAKAILRLVMIILIVGIAFSFSKDANLLENISLNFPNKWAIFAPISLFLIFIILMFMMLKEKYNRIDYNCHGIIPLNFFKILNHFFCSIYFIYFIIY